MAAAQQEIETKTTRPNFWDKFLGKRIVIQTRGRLIITGTFREYAPNHFLVLDQPVIKGSRTAKPPEVYVALAQVGHFHEECELEPKESAKQDQ